MNLTQDEIEKVRRQAAHCLDSLGGVSGHLASYSIAPGTFLITETEDLGAGNTKYSFSAEAYYESEFTVYEEDDGSDDPFKMPATQTISGYIALDRDYNLVRDDEGKVMFGPWHYVEPPQR